MYVGEIVDRHVYVWVACLAERVLYRPDHRLTEGPMVLLRVGQFLLLVSRSYLRASKEFRKRKPTATTATNVRMSQIYSR